MIKSSVFRSHARQAMCIFAFLILLCNQASAQLTINTGQTAAQLAQNLVGSGIIVTNPVLTCPNAASSGIFYGTSNVGIDSGIILTNGIAATVPGFTGANGANGLLADNHLGAAGDADLNSLSSQTTYDACILEFDFVPQGDSVRFKYVYASEDMAGLACSYNDPLGLFISGPGYASLTNIALIPGTAAPLTNYNINCASSPYYNGGINFVNNTGSTITYGGFAKLFTARAAVTACSTYHLKIAIADGVDDQFDSGVFLKKGSLSSSVMSTASQGGSVNGVNAITTPKPYAVRGCLNGKFIFKRSEASPSPQVINYVIAGTAVNGVDYTTIPASVTIPANDTTATVTIAPLSSASGVKTVKLQIYSTNPCAAPVIVDSVSLDIFDSLSTTIVTNDTTICAGQSVSIQATGDPLLAYSWSPATNLSSTNTANTVATPTATRTYFLAATFPGSTCPASRKKITITVKPLPVVTAPKQTLCSGQTSSVNLSSSISGTSYTWTVAQTGVTGASNSNGVTIAQTLTTTGAVAGTAIYDISSSANGCAGLVVKDTITVNPLPATPVASSNSAVCAGNTLNLSTATTAGVSYNWSGPNSFTSTAQNPSIASVTAAAAGTYNLYTVNTTTSCTSAVANTVVVINSLPATPTTAGSNTPVCAGNTLNLTTPTVAGMSYGWTGPNSFTAAVQNPSIASVTTAASGVYSVRLTNTTTGCISAAASTSVVISPLPTTPVLSSNSPLCVDQTLNLGTTTATSVIYNWSGPNSFASIAQNPSINNITTAGAGTYNLFVVNTVTGCTSATAPIVVVVNTLPATPTAASNTPICEGLTLNLTTPTVAGMSYNWTGPNSFTSTAQNPSIASATTAATGTYSVFAKNTTTGCVSAAAGTTVAAVNPRPAAPAPASNTPVCSGNTLNLTSTGSTGATYSWTGPNGYTSTSQNPSITGATPPAHTGIYAIVATYTATGCTSSGTTNVVVNYRPATPGPTSNSPLCVGQTLNMTASSDPGVTYSWTGPNSFTSSTQNPSISSVTTAAGGTYNVTATNAAGCPSITSGVLNVVINALPATPTANSNSPVCAGQTINLNTPAVTGMSYSWTGPNSFTSTSQNPSIPGATSAMAGTYSVRLTNIATGCASAATGSTPAVTITALPANPIVGSDVIVCEGNTLYLTSPTAGMAYNWTGPNGFSSGQQNPVIPTVTPAASGTYTLSISDPVTGCVAAATASQKATIKPKPAAPIATYIPTCMGNDLKLSASTVTGATYYWTGPNGFTSLYQNPTVTQTTPASNGIYTVEATVNACKSDKAPVGVALYPLPTPVVTINDKEMTTTQEYFTYQWYVRGRIIPGATSRNLTATEVGGYTVVVTDANGCSGTSFYVVYLGVNGQQLETPQIKIYPNPATNIVYIDATVEVNVSLRDITGRIIKTQEHAKSIDLGNIASGVYMISVTDMQGKLIKTERLVKGE